MNDRREAVQEGENIVCSYYFYGSIEDAETSEPAPAEVPPPASGDALAGAGSSVSPTAQAPRSNLAPGPRRSRPCALRFKRVQSLATGRPRRYPRSRPLKHQGQSPGDPALVHTKDTVWRLVALVTSVLAHSTYGECKIRRR
eukprot:jgi/Botrbrau1/22199/Bobra.168_1s0030.1